MTMGKMNKKGMFLPMFVISSIFILSALFAAMWSAEKEKNDLVGLRAVNIIKIGDEIEKIGLYLTLAADYSMPKTISALDANGGYSEDNTCQKTQKTATDQEEYVILNTCPLLDQKKEFGQQLKKDIKSYIDKYESSYRKTEHQSFLWTLEEDKTDYKKMYTDLVRTAALEDLGETDEGFSIKISALSFPVEANTESKILVHFAVDRKYPNLELYNELQQFAAVNCIKQDFLLCQYTIKKQFAKSEISKEDNLIKVKIHAQDSSVIKFAFYDDAELHNFIV